MLAAVKRKQEERMGPDQVHDLKVCLRKAESNKILAVRTGGSRPLEISGGQEKTGWHQVWILLCPERFRLDICPMVCGATVFEALFFRAEKVAAVAWSP